MRPIHRTVFLLALIAGSCNQAPREVEVYADYVQLPVVKGRPGAAYFTLSSKDQFWRYPIKIRSPKAERIEVHESRTEDGVARMRKIDMAGAEDSGQSFFRPGGKHAMIYGIDPDVKPGDRMPLIFEIGKFAPVTKDFEVRAFGAHHAGH